MNNDGLTPATPMASLSALFQRYQFHQGDVIKVDNGFYSSSTNIVLAAGESGLTIEGFNDPANPAALAVLNFESSKKILPQGMTFNPAIASTTAFNYGPMDFGPNWIIEILPYLEEQPLYDSFDLTTKINDSSVTSKNRIARGTLIPVLLCPSDGYNKSLYAQAGRVTTHGDNWARTNYAANAGRADLWWDITKGDRYMNGPDSPGWKDNCKRGVIGPNTSVKLARISDGTSKTILLGEIRAGISTGDSRGAWALGHAGATILAGYGAGGDDNGPNVCNPVHKEDDVFSNICADPEAASTCMSCDLGTYFSQATVRSVHVGGSFVTMCDGSVQFISDDIETTGPTINSPCCTVWDYMIASADGGQPGLYNGAVAGAECR